MPPLSLAAQGPGSGCLYAQGKICDIGHPYGRDGRNEDGNHQADRRRLEGGLQGNHLLTAPKRARGLDQAPKQANAVNESRSQKQSCHQGGLPSEDGPL